MSTPPAQPLLSVVIPVYNEEGILREAVTELRAAIAEHGWSCEILLAENGSRDNTVAIGASLSEELAEVEMFSCAEPNYGAALREGILRARGLYVICDEIDLCDTDFYKRALEVLDKREGDFVVGSKLLAGANDERPFVRHLGSMVINGMLRVSLGFRGTDTHGLKAFRRAVVAPVAERCIVDKDLFASELVIRAEREGVAMKEIPIRIKEMRDPSIHLFKRVPNVLKNLAKLVVAIRVKG